MFFVSNFIKDGKNSKENYQINNGPLSHEHPSKQSIYENFGLSFRLDGKESKISDLEASIPSWFRSHWISNRILLLQLNLDGLMGLTMNEPINLNTGQRFKIMRFSGEKLRKTEKSFELK